jgi:hypothetical protein
MVTYTVSSWKTSSSGAGRKSGTTLTGPIASSVYLIFALIDSFPSSPVASSKYSNHATAVCKPHSQYPASNSSEAVIPFLALAVGQVFSDNTVWISESVLGFSEGNPVFGLIQEILIGVPFEALLAHVGSVVPSQPESHI